VSLPFVAPNPIGNLTVALIFIAGGLLLGFMGRTLVRLLMTLVGALVGGALGYLVGTVVAAAPARVTFGGYVDLIIVLVLTISGALIGGVVFGLLVRAAVAFLGAIMAAALAGFLTGSVHIVLFAFIGGFALALYFVDELMGIIMALVGALLVATGVFLLTEQALPTVLAGIVVAVAGGVVQTLRLGRHLRTPAPPSPR
jgi:hypothetical protein